MSWSRIRRIFDRLEEDRWAELRILGGIGSGEGIIEQVRDAVVKGNDVDAGAAYKQLMLNETEFAQGQQGRPLGQAAQELAAGVEPGEMGARLLKIAVDYDQMLLHGRAAREALSELKRRTDDYYPAAVAALETLPAESVALVTQEISIRDLATE
jgi:hypothetical protein